MINLSTFCLELSELLHWQFGSTLCTDFFSHADFNQVPVIVLSFVHSDSRNIFLDNLMEKDFNWHNTRLAYVEHLV